MTKYIVQGGSPLFGEVHISGAKNAAVAILPAALLVDGVCRIENIPQISDVTVLLKILEQLGAKVRVLNRSDVELDCRHIVTTRAPQELAHKLRASYYLIGALLVGVNYAKGLALAAGKPLVLRRHQHTLTHCFLQRLSCGVQSLARGVQLRTAQAALIEPIDPQRAQQLAKIVVVAHRLTPPSAH